MLIKPCYVDIHIHTSQDANNINKGYDVSKLISEVKKISKENNYLISLTDHNTINKEAYLKLSAIDASFIVGVELHIRNYENCSPYHCHLFFNLENKDLSQSIDKLNSILDILYVNKLPDSNDTTIPSIQKILDSFDEFEYLVLPHGGQSHSTFDESIPSGVAFDTVMQRSIYYNIFDGFTSRTNNGLDKTIEYFKKLNINDFINLISCSDNYNVQCYPKGKDGTEHVKTWMFAEPSFRGLNLALTEKERLEYGDEPTDLFQHNIESVKYSGANLLIDVNLTPGLNAVIGNSSSGKTLFVDSLVSKLLNSKNEIYEKFGVNSLTVSNPSDVKPHYFSQNYILQSILSISKDDGSCDLSQVAILNDVFKLSEEDQANIESNMKRLTDLLNKLFKSAEKINESFNSLNSLPNFVKCTAFSVKVDNPFLKLVPNMQLINKIAYPKFTYEQDISNINEIKERFASNPLLPSIENEIGALTEKINLGFSIANFEISTRKILETSKKEIDDGNAGESSKDKAAQENRRSLFSIIPIVCENLKTFYDSLDDLSSFSFSVKSKEVDSSGHKLFIKNDLVITKEKIIEIFNKFLKSDFRVQDVAQIIPSLFVQGHFSERPRINNINEFKDKICAEFKELNKIKYQIFYNGIEDFDTLSPGMQSSVILDIILGYADDNAPLIIDQPEDNLSTDYINGGLISKIKSSKKTRQVIIVTHNATIPMLGDAQNIILCKNNSGKISITSHKMEDIFEGKPMTDWIAELTDGGKASIKKRFKKYNLKTFR